MRAAGMEIEAEVSGRTMKYTLKAAFNYYKCLACVKGWLNDTAYERRVK